MAVHERFVENVRMGEMILSRLMPGEDLFSALNRIAGAHGIERGVIVSAVGSVKDVIYRNVNLGAGLPVRVEETHQVTEQGPFELLSLQGNLFPSETGSDPVVHLHVLLGSPSGMVKGGHLLSATVFTTAEIMIGRIAGSTVVKSKSETTGLMELLKE
jgi:uncharacterized protein